MLSIINEFNEDDLEAIRNKGGLNARISQSESVYQVENDVYLVDTFSDVDFNEDLVYTSSVTIPTNNQIYQADNFCGACAIPYTALPRAEYDNFQTFNFGAETVVGKMLEGVFGTNTGFETYFSSKYRLKVKLYSYDYGVYKSVGLNGKMQKKGWTGLWAMHDDARATKLVLGWDALLFSIDIPYAKPINYQQLNSKAVSKEILKFANFSLESSGVSDVTIPFLDKKSNDWNFLEKSLTKLVKTSFADITKLVWQEAEQELAGASFEIRQAELKHYRKIYPDKTKLMLGREEVSHSNSKEISFVIDRHFQVSLDLSSNSNDLAKQILEPTFSNSKKMYEIDGASVFGAAIFDGQTRGIRIIKELE